MKIRKLNKHRAELSHKKHWLIYRDSGRLLIWTQSVNFKG